MGLFFSKKNEPPPPVTEIGRDTVFEGELSSKREVRIFGEARGSLKSGAAISIMPSGIVDGIINCQAFSVGGQFKGIAKVSGMLILEESGSFQGELAAGKLKVAKGAFIQGKIAG
jgi:cytoskeletal protein CcmA (bactofilin family)